MARINRIYFKSAFSVVVVLALQTIQVRAKPITVNVDSLPISLEPPALTDTIASWVLYHVADRLVEEHLPGQLQGGLAKRWTISSDRKTYCFDIADGRSFSDGTRVTGKSVANSFRLAMRHINASRVAFYLKNIAFIRVPKTNEVCVYLKQPTSNFLQILTDASLSIYKLGAVQGEFIYTGKYKLAEIITREERGVGAGIHLDLIRIKDGQTFRLWALSPLEAIQKYQAKELDIFRNSGTGGLDFALNNPGKKSVMPNERSLFFVANAKSPILMSRHQRQLLFANLKWTELNQYLAKLQVKLSPTLLSPTLMSLNVPDFIPPPSDQNADSSSKQSIWKNKKIRILTIGSYGFDEMIRTAFQGLNYTHLPKDKGGFLKAVRSGDFDVILIGYGITVRDWDYLSTLFYSRSSHNFSFVKDLEIDSWLTAARTTQHIEERASYFQKVLVKNYAQLWYIPVAHIPLIFLFSSSINPGFSGTIETVTTPWYNFDQVQRALP